MQRTVNAAMIGLGFGRFHSNFTPSFPCYEVVRDEMMKTSFIITIIAFLLTPVAAGPVHADVITGMFASGDLFSFDSISDFQTNTNPSFIGTRGFGQNGTNTSLLSDGSNVYAYFDNGDIWSWGSVADFATDTSASFVGNRALFSNGATNSLAMDGTGAVTALLFNGDVFTWSSVSDYITDTGATFLGTRGFGQNGSNTSIAQENDGTVSAFFDNGDIFIWASASDFATDTSASFVGNRSAGGIGSNVALVSGSTAVPEPSSLICYSAALMMGLASRRRRKAGQQLQQ